MSTDRLFAADRRAQVFTEYAMVVAAFVLVALAAIAVLSAGQARQVALGIQAPPGQHPGDNGPLRSGQLLPTIESPAGQTVLDFETITNQNNGATSRFGEALDAGTELEDWVVPVFPGDE